MSDDTIANPRLPIIEVDADATNRDWLRILATQREEEEEEEDVNHA